MSKNRIKMFSNFTESLRTSRQIDPKMQKRLKSFRQKSVQLTLQFPRAWGEIGFDDFRIMTPTQFSRQCLDFWKFQVKHPHLKQVRTAKPLSVLSSQVLSKIIQQFGAVLGFGFSALFKLYDMTPNLPICVYESCVHSLKHLLAAFGKESPYLRDKFSVAIASRNWRLKILFYFSASLLRCHTSKYKHKE